MNLKFSPSLVATSLLAVSLLTLATTSVAAPATPSSTSLVTPVATTPAVATSTPAYRAVVPVISDKSFLDISSYEVTLNAGLGYNQYDTAYHAHGNQVQSGIGFNFAGKLSRPVTYLGQAAVGIGGYSNLSIAFTSNKDFNYDHKISATSYTVNVMPLVTLDYGNPEDVQFRADLGLGAGYNFASNKLTPKGQAHGHDQDFHVSDFGYSGTAYVGVRMLALELGVRYVYHELNQYYGVDVGITF